MGLADKVQLDKRTFQDLVDEAKRRIPLYCPQWTNHNVSDPGVTLIELFAYMVDQLLFQINELPDKNYRAFLDMLGIHPQPAQPATARLLFRLTASPPAGSREPFTIEKGVEVATVRTETSPAYVFTTDSNLRLYSSRYKYLRLYSRATNSFQERDSIFTTERSQDWVSLFNNPPQEEDAFFLGFSEPVAQHLIEISLAIRSRSVDGLLLRDTPLVWQYWNGTQWKTFKPHKDGTNSFTSTSRSSQLELIIPADIARTSVNNREGWWISCVYKPQPGSTIRYSSSPQVQFLSINVMGGVVAATQARPIYNEELGISNGEPGQVFRLKNLPALPLAQEDCIEILPPGDLFQKWEQWQLVEDFAASGEIAPHFTFDPVEGEVSFGPNIRQSTGQSQQYGKIPEYGSRIRLNRYRLGGGAAGNVGAEKITVLKESLPRVASVTNPEPASGGKDAESLEEVVQVDARRLFRQPTRAVTGQDFVEIVKLCPAPRIARAIYIPPGENERLNGQVRLLVVPARDSHSENMLRLADLTISDEEQARLVDYLRQYCLVTVSPVIEQPTYLPIKVKIKVRLDRQADQAEVRQKIEEQLYGFIRPVRHPRDENLLKIGDFDAKEGWPLGSNLVNYYVAALVQPLKGVNTIESIEFFRGQFTRNGEITLTNSQPAPFIAVEGNTLLCSYNHEVVFA